MEVPGAERLPVGYARRAHGIAGSVIIRALTDIPQERYSVGAVLSTDEDPPRSVKIASVRPHKHGLLVSFEGIEDRDAAEALRGVTFMIPSDERRRLDIDEFWEGDLVGLEALDGVGGSLGIVTGVVFGRAQDRLRVTTPAGDVVEVPFVAAIVVDVSIELGRIVVDPPAGLF